MELYKFINERKIQKYKGGFVILDNRIYTNPKEETLKAAGYKPKIDDEKPKYDLDAQYLEAVYQNTDNAILVHWEVKEDTGFEYL